MHDPPWSTSPALPQSWPSVICGGFSWALPHDLQRTSSYRLHTSAPASQLQASWRMKTPARPVLEHFDFASPVLAIGHLRPIFLAPAVSLPHDVQRTSSKRLNTSAPGSQLLASWRMKTPARPALDHVDCASPVLAISHLRPIFLGPAVSLPHDVQRTSSKRLNTSAPGSQLLASWRMKTPARPALDHVGCASPVLAISHLRPIFLGPAVSLPHDVQRTSSKRLNTSAPGSQLLASWRMKTPARPALDHVGCASPVLAIGHLRPIFLGPAVSLPHDVQRTSSDRLHTSAPASQLQASWRMKKPARPALEYVDCAQLLSSHRQPVKISPACVVGDEI
ncbi:uncharacterized protein [Dermacentor albipictus]|uniref:uncharacterized protein isoform X2 n=1 Tax=Dermacentor albipictus TaxID=60249 RepID=UPI0038FCF04D